MCPLLQVYVFLSKYLFLSKAAPTELKKVFTCRKQDYRDSQDDIVERAQGLPVLCRPQPHLKLRKSAHTDGSERGESVCVRSRLRHLVPGSLKTLTV